MGTEQTLLPFMPKKCWIRFEQLQKEPSREWAKSEERHAEVGIRHLKKWTNTSDKKEDIPRSTPDPPCKEPGKRVSPEDDPRHFWRRFDLKNSR